MRRTTARDWIYRLLALGVLAGALAALIWLFAFAIQHGATIMAAILAAFATVSASVIVRYFERRNAIEGVRRERLGASYEALASALAGHEMPQRKRDRVIVDFMRGALLYASPAVLGAFRAWRDQLPPEDADWTPAETVANALSFENFVKAMRKDLGVSNWLLEEGDLSRAVLHDFDQYVAIALLHEASDGGEISPTRQSRASARAA